MQLKWPYESPPGVNTTRPMGDFDAAMEDGKLKVNLTPKMVIQSLTGFVQKCLAEEQITGLAFHCAWSPKDFKCNDAYGVGDNWPITYDEIKPYYDKVDRLIGVYGTNEGLENDPDGIFLPAPAPRLNELFVKKAAKGLGINVIAGRGSVLTAALPGNKDRGQCFYCGQCNRSCKVYGDFSASSCLVIPAMKTGNLTVVTNAVVREIITDNNGLATGCLT